MRVLFPLALAFTVVVHSTSAAITLVSDTRQVSASASATGGSGTNQQGPFAAAPPGTGLRWDANNSALASASVIGASAGGSAIQVSGWTIAGSLMLEAQGSCSTSISVTAASGGIAAAASASSTFDVIFDVDAGSLLSLQCSTSGVGVIRLENLTNAQLLFTGFGFYNATVGPARIRLLADATAMNNAPPGGPLGGGYSLLFSATPAPGTSAVLLIGGLGIARRRRG